MPGSKGAVVIGGGLAGAVAGGVIGAAVATRSPDSPTSKDEPSVWMED